MPATHQKKAQGEASRRRLLNAAAQLLGTGGYSSSSVDAIAKKAGVVKSALYWHFGNKKGLLMAALIQFTEGWVQEVQDAVDGASSPIDRLNRLLEHVQELILHGPLRRRMVFSMLVERGSHDEEVRSTIKGFYETMRQSLAEGFSESVQVPADRLYVISDALMSLCDGMFLQFMADQDAERLDRSVQEIRRIIVFRLAQEVQWAATQARNPSE